MISNDSEERKDRLRRLINKLDIKDIAEEVTPGVTTVPSKVDRYLDKFLTTDSDLINVKARVKKLSPADIPILLIGESGVGKELLAKALHGDRKGKFVAVNCGGIPDTLLESEFFGSIAGAFTGAINRQGYFEEAHNGTIFLDEIGEMPLLLQCKLLRVLQDMRIRRIGSTVEVNINCRIISATNKSIEKLQDNSHFRIDLFYRLAGHVITIKPLRERLTDVDLICDYYKVLYTSLPREVHWHGNVRELINKIKEYRILNNTVGTPPAM